MSKCDRCGYVFGDFSDQWTMHALSGDCIKYLKSEIVRLTAEIDAMRGTLAKDDTQQLRREVVLQLQEIEQLREVYDAARRWRDGFGSRSKTHMDNAAALRNAVDNAHERAIRKALEEVSDESMQ